MVKDKFRNLLDELGLSPEEFSEKIGVGKSGIYKILRGDTKKISDKLSKRISEVFPQFTYEQIKSFNYNKNENHLIIDEGEIEIQKIVDLIINNYEKFILNQDFKNLLDRHSLNSIKEYLSKNNYEIPK